MPTPGAASGDAARLDMTLTTTAQVVPCSRTATRVTSYERALELDGTTTVYPRSPNAGQGRLDQDNTITLSRPAAG